MLVSEPVRGRSRATELPCLNSEYTCTIDDFQVFIYSVFPYKAMHVTIYGHITKYHEGNACRLRHSSSPRSLRGSFISPRGRMFEYRPRGLINKVQFIFKKIVFPKKALFHL